MHLTQQAWLGCNLRQKSSTPPKQQPTHPVDLIAVILCLRQVYTRLNERLGLADHLLVLNVMLTKIGTNLKVFGSCEDVVEQTLTLFQARTYVSLARQR